MPRGPVTGGFLSGKRHRLQGVTPCAIVLQKRITIVLIGIHDEKNVFV